MKMNNKYIYYLLLLTTWGRSMSIAAFCKSFDSQYSRADSPGRQPFLKITWFQGLLVKIPKIATWSAVGLVSATSVFFVAFWWRSGVRSSCGAYMLNRFSVFDVRNSDTLFNNSHCFCSFVSGIILSPLPLCTVSSTSTFVKPSFIFTDISKKIKVSFRFCLFCNKLKGRWEKFV